MRVTKRMLELANNRRSTKRERGSSLSEYVGKKGVAGSRLSAMNAVDTRTARIQKSQSDRLAKSATGLTGALSAMSAKVDEGSGDLSGETAAAVQKYNETLKALKSATGTLDQFYYRSMREVAETNQKELGEIGITVSADGSLALNREKFAGADREKVKKLLGAKGDFAQRAGYVASRVTDNARAGAASLSIRYDASGNIVNSYLNRYHFRG